MKLDPIVFWESVDTIAHDIFFDGTRDDYPYTVEAWGNASKKRALKIEDPQASTFGFVFSDGAVIIRNIGGSKFKLSLAAGMFFSCPGVFQIRGGSGFVAIVINDNKPKSRQGKRNCKCIFNVGGPIEEDGNGHLTGMLAYIDGCSDSILIHPPILGAPCLNHLHFPSGIKQTQHTHPSGE